MASIRTFFEGTGMELNLNGGGPTPAPTPEEADVIRDKALAHVRGYVENVMQVVMNGLMQTAVVVPGEIIIRETCHVLGRMIGQMYMGPEDAVTKFRRDCRDAFSDAMRSEKIRPMPRPAPVGGDTALDLVLPH
jgi:hypothetical protein